MKMVLQSLLPQRRPRPITKSRYVLTVAAKDMSRNAARTVCITRPKQSDIPTVAAATPANDAAEDVNAYDGLTLQDGSSSDAEVKMPKSSVKCLVTCVLAIHIIF